MQERRNSIANALELRLSCTNPSISYHCRLRSAKNDVLMTDAVSATHSCAVFDDNQKVKLDV